MGKYVDLQRGIVFFGFFAVLKRYLLIGRCVWGGKICLVLRWSVFLSVVLVAYMRAHYSGLTASNCIDCSKCYWISTTTLKVIYTDLLC